MDKEYDISERLDKYLTEAERYKDQFKDKWMEYEAFYKGYQWRNDPQRLKTVKNIIFQTIESELPILLDSSPSVTALPADQDSEEAMLQAEMLSRAMEYVFEDQNLALKQTEGMKASLIMGTGFLRVEVDPFGDNGTNQIIINSVSWRDVVVDPLSKNILDGKYFAFKTPMRRCDVQRLYPDKDIEANFALDLSNLSYSQIAGRFAETHAVYNEYQRGNEISRYDLEDMCILEEWFVRDYDMQDIPEEKTHQEIQENIELIMAGKNPKVYLYQDHQLHIKSMYELKMMLASEAMNIPLEEVTPEQADSISQNEQLAIMNAIIDDAVRLHQIFEQVNPDSQEPKYKNHLRVIKRVGKTILEDREDPVGDGAFPVAPIFCYPDDSSPFAVGETHNLQSIQETINRCDDAEMKSLHFNANTGWIKDKGAGVDDSDLTNAPNMIIEKNQGFEVTRIPAGQVSPQLEGRKRSDLDFARLISGINENTVGQTPTGVTAGNAIQALQQQSIGRIRLKTNLLEQFTLKQLGKLVCSRILKFWTSDKKIHLYDDNGRIKTYTYNPEVMENFKYQIAIVKGSTTGINKQTIFQTMSQLAMNGAIPMRTFLQTNDIPFKNKIIDALDEQDQIQMQLQQLAQENEQLKAMLQNNNMTTEQVPMEQVPVEEQGM